MKFEQEQAQIRQYPYPTLGEFNGPGMGGGYPFPGVGTGGNSLQPYGGGLLPAAPTNAPQPVSSTGGSGSGSGFNLNQIKTFVDRMGGVEGIMGTMTKVQKIFGTLQQMQPMLKLLLGSFGSKAAAQSASRSGDAIRRRRRKQRPGATRRPGGSNGPGRSRNRRR